MKDSELNAYEVAVKHISQYIRDGRMDAMALRNLVGDHTIVGRDGKTFGTLQTDDQQAIKEKESTLNAIINTSDDTFFALDLDYRITVVNDTLKKRFEASGISLNEGDNIFDKLPEDTHEVWKERYSRALGGESFTQDQERKVKDKTLYIRGYYDPILDQDGKIIGASVRSSDISEMKEIMDKLEETQKELAKLKK